MNYSDHWFNRYCALFRSNYLAAGASAALLFFVAGLTVAVFSHFVSAYVRTVPIYLGVFGIGWVTTWAGLFSGQVPRIIDSSRPAFALNQAEFASVTEAWKRRIFDARVQLLVAAPIIAAVCVTIVICVNHHFNPWFPDEWLQPPALLGKVIILCLFTVGIGVLVVSCGLAMLTYCVCVIDLSRKPLVPVLGFVKFTLTPIADLSIPCWFSWTVGVALFVLLFRPAFIAVNIIVVGMLTALGFIMLLVPHFALYRALKSTKDAILASGWRYLLDAHYDREHPVSLVSKPNHLRAHEFLRSVAETKIWPNDPSNALLLLGTWLIPIATMAIQEVYLKKGH